MYEKAKPAGEEQRLSALHRAGLLDSPPEALFDDLARLAARLCGAEIAGLGLVDRDRVWFKARHGPLPAQIPRSASACAHALSAPGFLEVPDASDDERFRDFAEGAEVGARFFAGVALRDRDGQAAGVLFVVDRNPRRLDPGQAEALEALARQAVAHIETWRQSVPLAAENAQLEWAMGRLAESEARLLAILRTSVEAILTIDERGTVQSFNTAAERIFGWQASEVVGRNVHMLMPEPDGSRHDGYLRAYLETGVATVIGRGRETVGRRRDGSPVPLHLSVAEVRLGAQRIFTGFLRDLTEQKELDRMKAELVSVVSHELRTPLTSIHCSMQLLEAGVGGPLAGTEKEVVSIALRNTTRLLRLVGDLLDLEKLEAGHLTLESAEWSAAQLVEAAVDGVSAMAQSWKVGVDRLPAGDLRVRADRDRVIQVLTNFLSNALKFSPEGGRVAVEVCSRGEAVRFTVADRGPGIPADQLHRLFGKFEQLAAHDARRRGSGLGLAISKALVERHGGRVGVDSRVGEGSRFWFELPRAAGGSGTAG